MYSIKISSQSADIYLMLEEATRKKYMDKLNLGHFWPVTVCFLTKKTVFNLVSVFISFSYFCKFPFYVRTFSSLVFGLSRTNLKTKYGSNLRFFFSGWWNQRTSIFQNKNWRKNKTEQNWKYDRPYRKV